MTGPDIQIHIDPTATPVTAHTPAMVPLHWQDEVEKQIKDDVAMGVLEEESLRRTLIVVSSNGNNKEGRW